jgi:oxygen-independent coproporphyrinogen-3 oxidase
MVSLYLHFPFCKRKCSYCDFCSAASSSWAEMAAYCRALETEMRLQAARYGHIPVDTVFLGGGTPSVVPADLMRGVLATLRECFAIQPDAEFTSEANPGTLTVEWLDVLCDAGMNRLSLGVQAIQPQLLKTLERIHDFTQAREAFAMARAAGVANISADAMFGLPGQTMGEYLDTLRALAGEGVTHISAYALIVEDGTPLAAQVQRGELAPAGDDLTADMLEVGVDLLTALGYERYEISNFAKAGFACRHNLGYWQRKRYLGLGASAASLLPPEAAGVRAAAKAGVEQEDTAYVRACNTADVRAYTDALLAGSLPPCETTPVSRRDAMFETVMLGLRTVEGVRLADFAAWHGRALADVYAAAVETLRTQGLLAEDALAAGRLALNRRGLRLQNTALMPFL